MRISSKEFRDRAIEAYKSGCYTQALIAEVFGVTRKTISNWLRIERTEQRTEPLPRGHKRESFTDEEKDRLIQLVKEKPDLTLVQLRTLIGKNCSIKTVHNTLRRLNLYLKKKTLKAKEQDRHDVKDARATWILWQQNININNLIFIDESSAKTNMCKLYGRSIRGERCYDSVPASWSTTTMISSIRYNGATECIVFDGAIDRIMLRVYMKDVLLPTLQRGDRVVLDNLSSHKDEYVISRP